VSLALLHRRLTMAMGLTALLAFAGGAGFEPVSATLAALGLTAAFFWQPDPELSRKLERIWLPLAFLLVLRSLYHVFLVGDDVVIPVVDLLLLLMCAEGLRSLDAPNDIRLYALSFALLLASTAYRPGLLFAMAFVAYVALATVGLMTGHLRRQSRGHDEISLRRGFLWKMAASSGVILIMAGIVFVAFPRISRGWASRGETMASSIAGFSDQVSLGSHGARIYPNPQIVLRVEFPEGEPEEMSRYYWRGRSYDRFDGVRWSRSSGLPSAMAPGDWYRRWGPERTLQRIYGAPLEERVLFALHPMVSVDPDARRIATLFDNAGDHIYWGSGQPTYDAVSVTSRPSAEDLRNATGRFRPARRFYTQLPELPARIEELTREITADAATDYDRAVAIERYFQENFDYTLNLPATAAEATLDHFLFERRAGHCEYFSTAMAVMLRQLGINAREVNGFLGGQWNEFGQFLAVTQNEAHSWVEVWFPGYGWVPFDPTPAAAGDSETLQSWMWPGRFWFDGLQHRWNKWVLDYDTDQQGSFFSGLREIFSPEPTPETAARGSGTGDSNRGLWITLLAVAALGGLVWIRIGSDRLAPESRLYLRLRDAYESAGFPTRADLTSTDLLEALKHRRHPAHAPSRRLVELYRRARFGGDGLSDRERNEMNRALSAARRAMRRSE